MHRETEQQEQTEWRADLHAHSTASDGLLEPKEVVKRAKDAGLDLLALTDHDTLHGIPEAREAAKAVGIRLIAGVEVGAQGEESIHVLGYFIDDRMKDLLQLIGRLRDARATRQDQFLARLEELGMPMKPSDIPTPPGAAFSRATLARGMVTKGYASSTADAFDRFIGVGKLAYVPRFFISVEELVSLMRDEGAVPVLAHPGLVEKNVMDRLPKWVAAGLMGIEAYHVAHAPERQAYWDAVARSMGLLVTGGSDFHGPMDPSHGELGSLLPFWPDHHTDTMKLLEHARD